MKKLSYSKLKSHPDKLLEDHLENVATLSKFSFNSLKFKYNKLFSEISYLIGLSHDFAKSTSFFQDYLLKGQKTEFSFHSFLSAIFTYYVVNEFINLKNINFDNLSIIAYIVVLHHHGNIRNIPDLMDYHDEKIDSKLIKKQLEDLTGNCELLNFYINKNIDLTNFFDNFFDICEDISDELFEFKYDCNFDNYFYILLFYSILLDADKMDASGSNIIKREVISENIVDNYKLDHNFDVKGINEIREKAYLEVKDNIEKIDLSNRIFSMNLPTGIGKTLTGVSCAINLKNKIINEYGFNPRIIYSLPFLSVIDQNESIIRNIFNENGLNGSNLLLKHNHLAKMSYLDNNLNEVYDIKNSKILIEGWNSEFIITTFIQFFYSLVGNKNSFLRKFHNIANSIILLDEIQSIPYKYWRIINLLLKKLANEFNCWIILMTATQPFIFHEDEIFSLVDDSEFYFNQFNRVDYNFNLNAMLIEEFGINLIKDIEKNNNKDFLVVLNTIDSSKQVYKLIKDYYENNEFKIYIDDDGICHVGDKLNLIYLSTNILPFNRLKKISFIKNSNTQNIIISTQLIEAGIDIDVDIVYRDFAPLDSIIQTAGRCNRENKKDKGIVNVVNLVNNNQKQYSNLIYESLLLTTTKEVIGDISEISEKDFNLKYSKIYFKKISERNFGDEELNSIMKNLRFADIPLKFKLIENSQNKLDVFICVNEEANQIFNKYKFIVNNLKGFNRQNEFLKIKNKFYQYVISVDEKKFGSTNLFNDEIGVIFKDDLNRKYSLDLGFIDEDEEGPMIW